MVADVCIDTISHINFWTMFERADDMRCVKFIAGPYGAFLYQEEGEGAGGGGALESPEPHLQISQTIQTTSQHLLEKRIKSKLRATSKSCCVLKHVINRMQTFELETTPIQRSSERAIERSSNRESERLGERLSERSSERSSEPSSEPAIERAIERAIKQSSDEDKKSKLELQTTV